MKLRSAHFIALLLMALATLGGGGCKTSEETQNLSERPWNNPRGWETGLPGRMNEGR